MALNIADLFEHAVDAAPDKPAVKVGDVVISYTELEAESNRLAHFFASRGIGAGDHVGVYAKNSIEHVIAVLAILKVRAVAINVNYRYVEGELNYLFENADLVALVHERPYADLVALCAPKHEKLQTVVVIPDVLDPTSDADISSYDGVLLADAVDGQSPERDFAERSNDDLHIIYTGGTTGFPKGVMWRHEDFWRVLGGGIDFTTGVPLEEFDQSEQAKLDGRMTTFPLSPLMHGGAQAGLLMHLFAGHLTVLEPKFDPVKTWEIIERDKVQLIFMTGDAMARPLIEAYEAKQAEGTSYDCSNLLAISSSAAIFSPPVKARWMTAFPNSFFTDSIGASETGFQGMGLQEKGNISSDGPVVALGPASVVIGDDGEVLDLETNVGAIGRLGRGGSVPVGYYKDPEKSAKTFLEIGGQRYSVPGDFARIEEEGKVTLLGRGSNCVNTGGEKVYPEEVEMAIKGHPAVYDCLVVGIPDEKYGQSVAVVDPAPRGPPGRARGAARVPPRPPLGLQAAAQPDAGPRDPAQRDRQGAVPACQGDDPGGSRHRAGGLGMMRSPLCEAFGIEYPIFAFTPSEHVAAAVSKAGGLGVLGCVRFNDTEELESVLTWLDDNTDGKPYGVDIVMPMKIPTEGTSLDLGAMIPDDHKKFVDETLLKLGVPPLPEGEGRDGVLGWLHSVARSHLDVALKHRPVFIANALGSPPKDVIDKCHEHGIQIGALAGAAKHALSHVANGVDIIIAQGYEAGGHTGEVASMVLQPDIVDAVGPDVPVLGAGGIGCGRQIAASMALGSQGVWMGSIWLGTAEYQLMGTGNTEAWETAFTRATSSDTVRTRVYTGKPARLLKTKWTEAWAEEGAPAPLPMPLQNLLVSDAHNRISAANDPDVISMPVGQIVGRMNEVRPVAEVMADLVSEFEETVARLDKLR